MPQVSAGILLYRRRDTVEVFVARMGGPFWEKKDAGAWSVPKGLVEPGEDDLVAARREFFEEVGQHAPDTSYEHLIDVRGRKTVRVFVGEAADAAFVASNLFELEWPPRSGRIQQFPEMIDARWVPVSGAREKLVKGQWAVIDALENRLE